MYVNAIQNEKKNMHNPCLGIGARIKYNINYFLSTTYVDHLPVGFKQKIMKMGKKQRMLSGQVSQYKVKVVHVYLLDLVLCTCVT